MTKKNTDRKADIDDTRVLPLEEIINMRRRIHDLEDREEEHDEEEVIQPIGKSSFILNTSTSTKLRRDALERKHRQMENQEIEQGEVEIPFVKTGIDEKEKKALVLEEDKEATLVEKPAADESEAVENEHSVDVDKKITAVEKEEVVSTEVENISNPEVVSECIEDAMETEAIQDNGTVRDEKQGDDPEETTSVSETVEGDQESVEIEDGVPAEDTQQLPSKEQIENTQELALVSEKPTYEEKKKQELEKKPTLEEKRSVDLEKATIEEKRKKELQHAITLEEKRKQQLENKMTLEEKRALRKQNVSLEKPKPTFSIASYFHSLQALDILSMIITVVNVCLDVYITWKINTYFSIGYAAIFFFIVLLLLTGTFFMMMIKRKLGLVLNLLLVLLLGVGSLATMRFHTFVSTVFDNSESETVMIVVKKDSSIDADTDLKDKRLAMVKIDGDANVFAEEILTEENKSGYIKESYATYKEAYDALLEDKTDLMVYTGLARQRLSEEEIDSWSNVKVIYQKNRKLAAIEGTKVNILKDPFTVLISGVDLTSESINEKGSSDVNILFAVNPNTKKVIMQTIPRDTWIPLTCSNNEHTKLTYAGAYGGTDCSIKTLEQYLDIEINYYAKINFKGVIDLVDTLGGIRVNSDVSFCESHPLDGYGVRDYCYNAGWNDINGVEALMFSRIRKVFGNGDLERGNHQMEVINAVIRKFKEEPSLAHLNSLMNSVENSFATNLEDDDFGKCLELFLGMSQQLSEIESYSMEGEIDWATDEVTGEHLYYFYPYEGQIELVKERMKSVLNGE